MPEYLAPGVYVEEIERGPKPIEGVATSTAAFLGRGAARPAGAAAGHQLRRVPALVRRHLRRRQVPALRGEDLLRQRRAPLLRHPRRRGRGGRRHGRTSAASPSPPPDRAPPTTTPGSASCPAAPRRGRQPRGLPPPPGLLGQPRRRPRRRRRHRRRARSRTVAEDFDDLSLDPASPSYFVKRVNGVQLLPRARSRPPTTPTLPTGDGVSGAARRRRGRRPAHRGRLRGRRRRPRPAPGPQGARARPVPRGGHRLRPRRRLRHGAAWWSRTASATGSASPSSTPSRAEANADGIEPRSDVTDTKYGAFYYPWIYVSDPRSGVRTKVPPGGSVCGIYALTDNTRGVFKAPANETLAGAVDLEYDVNQGTQEVLNPRGVNVIRRFPGRGIRLWGARTMSSDPLWKYVNVRRLFIFLEASIYNSTQWVVFEPNDPRLWARVKQTVTLFLRTQWREGALLGAEGGGGVLRRGGPGDDDRGRPPQRPPHRRGRRGARPAGRVRRLPGLPEDAGGEVMTATTQGGLSDGTHRTRSGSSGSGWRSTGSSRPRSPRSPSGTSRATRSSTARATRPASRSASSPA